MIRVRTHLVKRYYNGSHKPSSSGSSTHVKKDSTTTSHSTSDISSATKHKHHHHHKTHHSHSDKHKNSYSKSKSTNTNIQIHNDSDSHKKSSSKSKKRDSSSTSTSSNGKRLIINLTPIKYSQLRLISEPTHHLVPGKYDQLTPGKYTHKRLTKAQKLTQSLQDINRLIKNSDTGMIKRSMGSTGSSSSTEYQKEKHHISEDRKTIKSIHHEISHTNVEITKNSKFLRKQKTKLNH